MERFAGVGSGTAEKADVPLMQYTRPLRTWAGHGSGAKCDLCGGTIQPHEIEYEVELPAAGITRAAERWSDAQRVGHAQLAGAPRFQAAGNGSSLRFHFGCYRNWSRR